MSRGRSSYSLEEVRRIVEQYVELRARADTHAAGLRTLTLLIDLDRALPQLPLTLRAVVVMHGLAGIDMETVADVLQVSRKTISKRYHEALELLHFNMNGGFHF